MKLLVDTQCWLWMLAAPERFASDARAVVESVDNELLLSAASAWEIAVKHANGKLRLPEPPPRFVPSRIDSSGVRTLAIELAHVLQALQLPAHHSDPFDRLLIAQARVERMPILTADPIFDRYDVETIDARR